MKRQRPGFPISQTEYDCPAQQNHDPQQRVLIWLLQGALVCMIVLIIAFTWVMVT